TIDSGSRKVRLRNDPLAGGGAAPPPGGGGGWGPGGGVAWGARARGEAAGRVITLGRRRGGGRWGGAWRLLGRRIQALLLGKLLRCGVGIRPALRNLLCRGFSRPLRLVRRTSPGISHPSDCALPD